MIRINLLGTPKPKKGKLASIRIGGGEGASVLVTVLIVLLIAAAGNGIFYYKLRRDAARLQAEMTAANSEYVRLLQVKSRYEELERQKNSYKRRVDIIDELHSKQSGPVDLLSTIGRTVNHTDEVWLNSMNDNGTIINLKGVALSVHAVADLMRNLQTSGYFKNVEIKSSYQDEAVKDMQAFIFELNCEKRTAAPAAAAAAPVKKS